MSLYLQSLALIEDELDMKLNILKVLQHFSKNSGKYHWTKDAIGKLSVVNIGQKMPLENCLLFLLKQAIAMYFLNEGRQLFQINILLFVGSSNALFYLFLLKLKKIN